MRIIYILGYFIFSSLFITRASAQSYDLINYNLNGTPVHGLKIKTHIPFFSHGSMPTVRIEGYFYGPSAPVGLNIVWYVYNDNFINAKVSSWGNSTPQIYLSNEDGLISIFLNIKPSNPRFKVTAFAQGRPTEDSTAFSGWTVADEALGGTNQLLVPYANSFAGTVSVNGKLVVNGDNVLIGKTSQTNTSYKLDVNGDVRANKVVVNTTGADFVFDATYPLLSLDSLERYLKTRHRLPGIPSATEMRQQGLDVGENQTRLLQKLEEMTLYIINQQKEISALKKELEEAKEKNNHEM